MTKAIKSVAIYARVSTDKQTTDNQVQQLRSYVERMGWVLVDEYIDQGVSGSKGKDARPQYKRLDADVMKRKFDVVLCWKLDRLSRSLKDLMEFSSLLEEKGVDLVAYDQQIDTTTASGKLFFHMIGAFAEFERGIIVERVMAGIARSKIGGTKSGRLHGRPPNVSNPEELVLKARSEGKGILRIAKEIGIGTSTVQRILKGSLQLP